MGDQKSDPFFSRGMIEVLKRKNENEKRYEHRTVHGSDKKEYKEMRDSGGYEESKGENVFKSMKLSKSDSM